jgi:phosphate transport system protein
VAVNAFVDRDPSWAAALADMDETIDELEKSVFRHVLGEQRQHDEAALLRAVQLALVARHYERVGDHAVSIAQHVHFVATGEHSRFRRRRS